MAKKLNGTVIVTAATHDALCATDTRHRQRQRKKSA